MGGNRQNRQFSFCLYFLKNMQFFPRTVKTAKTVKPASLVPSVFEESSRRTLGNRQNRQFFKKGLPIGSKEPFAYPPFAYPPLPTTRLYETYFLGLQTPPTGQSQPTCLFV